LELSTLEAKNKKRLEETTEMEKSTGEFKDPQKRGSENQKKSRQTKKSETVGRFMTDSRGPMERTVGERRGKTGAEKKRKGGTSAKLQQKFVNEPIRKKGFGGKTGGVGTNRRVQKEGVGETILR